MTTAVPSPNAPRPASPLVREVADMLRRIEINYGREGSGPGSRFEGRLLEDVQAEAVFRHLRGPDLSPDDGMPRSPWGRPFPSTATIPTRQGES